MNIRLRTHSIDHRAWRFATTGTDARKPPLRRLVRSIHKATLDGGGAPKISIPALAKEIQWDMANASHSGQFLPHRADQFCPCCNSGLRKVQRDLVEISSLVAKPLSAAAQASLEPILNEIRTTGLAMLDDLRRSFEDGEMPVYPAAFEKAVSRFGAGIDAFTKSGRARGITEAGVFHLYALRFAFARLVRDMRELVDELNIHPQSRQ